MGSVSEPGLWAATEDNLLFSAPCTELHGAAAAGLDDPTRSFKLYFNATECTRLAAQRILEARYAFRGYRCPAPSTESAMVSLLACLDDVPVGTISVRFDSASGFCCEQSFRQEVGRLRSGGHRICEFTRLAVEPRAGSRKVTEALFHAAFIVAHRVRRCDDVLIEVNPRHVAFYQRCLGFGRMGEQKQHEQVGAPAVLMKCCLHRMDESIRSASSSLQRCDSHALARVTYAFDPAQDRAIEHRLERSIECLARTQARPAAPGRSGSCAHG